jgi:Spy/CpxP family protein refolding chaperone
MVIFGAGVVTGALVVRQTSSLNAPVRQRPPVPLRSAMSSAPGDLRLEFLRRAQRELDLSPDQRERIDKIIKDSQERNRKLIEPVAPELHAQLQRTKEQFLQVLNPEQRARFDRLAKRQGRPHEPRRPTSTP